MLMLLLILRASDLSPETRVLAYDYITISTYILNRRPKSHSDVVLALSPQK